MRFRTAKTIFLKHLLCISTFLAGCSDSFHNSFHNTFHNTLPSQTETVDIPQSPAKNQIIGNCWDYAVMGWAESQHLQATGELLDLSEAYITYRHFETQLMAMSSSTPNEGKQVIAAGDFPTARSLIANYGLLRETDFSPQTSTPSTDKREENAINAVNQSLKTGDLEKLLSTKMSDDAKNTLIHTVLDAAFGVKIDALANKIISANNFIVGTNSGKSVMLSDEIYRWHYVEFPINENSLPGASKLPFQAALNNEQTLIIRNVMRALNQHKPVFVAWLVDVNAMGSEGTFSAETLQQKGAGSQGLHITLLADYTATLTDLNTHAQITTPEGEVDDALKTRAAEEGLLKSLIVKNSWGQNPKATYPRHGEYGYNKLNSDYLFSWIGRTDAAQKPIGSDLVLRSFILP